MTIYFVKSISLDNAVDYNKIPSPCYVIDEERLRKNLKLIKHVSDESGAEIILAFKGFAMWGVFPVLREYISGAAASSADEARLCFDEIGSRLIPIHLCIRITILKQFCRYSSHLTFNSLNQYNKFSNDL